MNFWKIKFITDAMKQLILILKNLSKDNK